MEVISKLIICIVIFFSVLINRNGVKYVKNLWNCITKKKNSFRLVNGLFIIADLPDVKHSSS